MVLFLAICVLLAAWVINPSGPAAILLFLDGVWEGWKEKRAEAKKAKEEEEK